MICQDFLSWHDRFLFQMFDNPKIWDKSIYAWNCFDLWRLMQRAKAFFRQELYYSHGAQKKCCLCQGVSHSCFFGRNELLWVQRGPTPQRRHKPSEGLNTEVQICRFEPPKRCGMACSLLCLLVMHCASGFHRWATRRILCRSVTLRVGWNLG